jgi:hypothetical protein
MEGWFDVVGPIDSPVGQLIGVEPVGSCTASSDNWSIRIDGSQNVHAYMGPSFTVTSGTGAHVELDAFFHVALEVERTPPTFAVARLYVNGSVVQTFASSAASLEGNCGYHIASLPGNSVQRVGLLLGTLRYSSIARYGGAPFSPSPMLRRDASTTFLFDVTASSVFPITDGPYVLSGDSPILFSAGPGC